MMPSLRFQRTKTILLDGEGCLFPYPGVYYCTTIYTLHLGLHHRPSPGSPSRSRDFATHTSDCSFVTTTTTFLIEPHWLGEKFLTNLLLPPTPPLWSNSDNIFSGCFLGTGFCPSTSSSRSRLEALTPWSAGRGSGVCGGGSEGIEAAALTGQMEKTFSLSFVFLARWDESPGFWTSLSLCVCVCVRGKERTFVARSTATPLLRRERTRKGQTLVARWEEWIHAAKWDKSFVDFGAVLLQQQVLITGHPRVLQRGWAKSPF